MWSKIEEGGNERSGGNSTRMGTTKERDKPIIMYNKSDVTAAIMTPPGFLLEDAEDERVQPDILTPPSSCEEPKSPGLKDPPPDLPKMFFDLLEPIPGLKQKKLEFSCPICSLRLASHNSLVTHNKAHERPACLNCLKRFPSLSSMSKHSQMCRQVTTVLVTSKYGRSRNVRCYLGFN